MIFLEFLVVFCVLGMIVALLTLAGFLKISEWRFIRKFRKGGYTCKDVKKDIDFYFSGGAGKTTPEQEKAIKRAIINHMTVGSTLEEHNIACQKCWDYYQQMKREHCGG